ncbi:hypothetical protein DM02DRAFT_734155 [Periconia macrospinosa]|uniref:Osmotin, thaumatin-like protein n=1 Tax=Periconia macrospinosa TaxID=97972 RepID=A0A2V1D0C3_9PLEO|nr:hypothetical protein DM02DRAFT_734155 [Periconia macrospinosa]
MGFRYFRRILVAAFVAVTFVQATPFWAMDDLHLGLGRRDMVVPGPCPQLVLGATRTPIGTVCVSSSGGSITITYTIDSANTYTLFHVHAWIGIGVPTITQPGQMPYTDENHVCTIASGGKSAVCTIPTTGPNAFPPRCSGAFNVVAHAELGASAGTAWGNGTCYDDKGNCAKYFPVNPQCQCPVVTTYDPVIHENIYSTVKTITTTESTTVHCTSTPDAVTSSTSCDNPNAAPTVTISSSKSLDFTCGNPYTTPPP